MRPPASVVVFSDVDAVLADPRKPAFAVAGRLLQPLVAEDVALVLCSSRTRAELEFIQQMFGITDPFSCENGAAAFIPHGCFPFDISSARELPGYHTIEFGRPYIDVVDTLNRTAARLRIEIVGFNDMSIEEVARECGVSLLDARLAKLREYEERFRILDSSPSAASRLMRALSASRLRCIDDDSFYYVGAPVDHRPGVELLDGLYRRAGSGVQTIAVTDVLREHNLGSLADHRIIVLDDDIVSGSVGVTDWAEAIVGGIQDLRRTDFHIASRPGRGQ
jgi:predicted mannosyl-3-phosphoglycerate phosphatase (HAD superfamily)